jgi:hypothetical protein
MGEMTAEHIIEQTCQWIDKRTRQKCAEIAQYELCIGCDGRVFMLLCNVHRPSVAVLE